MFDASLGRRDSLVVGGLLLLAALILQADVLWKQRIAALKAAAANSTEYKVWQP